MKQRPLVLPDIPVVLALVVLGACFRSLPVFSQIEPISLVGTQFQETLQLVPAKSPHMITGTYFVPQNRKLKIAAGCVFLVAKDAQLTVSGALIVNGNVNKPVVLKGKASGFGSWKGLRLDGAQSVHIKGAQILGAEVGVIISGSSATFEDCIFARCVNAISLKGGRKSVFRNCLFTECKGDAFRDNLSGATLDHCTLTQNKGWGYFCEYYGHPVLLASIVTKNRAGGVRGAGYDHKSEAHGSIIFGNRGIDVLARGTADWDYSGNWWGKANTQKLMSQGDASDLTCIEDALDRPGVGRVRIHEFLTEPPKDCGSTLTW